MAQPLHVSSCLRATLALGPCDSARVAMAAVGVAGRTANSTVLLGYAVHTENAADLCVAMWKGFQMVLLKYNFQSKTCTITRLGYKSTPPTYKTQREIGVDTQTHRDLNSE